MGFVETEIASTVVPHMKALISAYISWGSFNNHVDMNRGGGGLTNVHYVHLDIGKRCQKCPNLSTQGGEGVKNGQNLVHVVIE